MDARWHEVDWAKELVIQPGRTRKDEQIDGAACQSVRFRHSFIQTAGHKLGECVVVNDSEKEFASVFRIEVILARMVRLVETGRRRETKEAVGVQIQDCMV
jgi:hypothetical protein